MSVLHSFASAAVLYACIARVTGAAGPLSDSFCIYDLFVYFPSFVSCNFPKCVCSIRRLQYVYLLHNQDGFTALMLAAINDHVGCVRLLLDAGANKNAKHIYVRIGWCIIPISMIILQLFSADLHLSFAYILLAGESESVWLFVALYFLFSVGNHA